MDKSLVSCFFLTHGVVARKSHFRVRRANFGSRGICVVRYGENPVILREKVLLYTTVLFFAFFRLNFVIIRNRFLVQRPIL